MTKYLITQMQIKILLFVLTALFLFISCSNKKQADHPTQHLVQDTLLFFDELDRLLLFASFDECGEWGGHEESFEIFTKEDRKFYALYKKTKINCDSIGRLYGTPEFHKPAFSKEFKLSDKEKKAISSYLQKLISGKIKERFPGHAGKTFSVINSDSTLFISIYDNNEENLHNYNTLLEIFNLEKVDYE